MLFFKKCLNGIVLPAVTAFFILASPAHEARAESLVLDNGLTVLVTEDHSQPIVSIQAWIRAGSATEGRFLGAGISHLVEHMLFKSTRSFKEGELHKFIKLNGGDINAFTSKDYTAVQILLPKEKLSDGLETAKEMLFFCKFDEAELEREKQVILNEMKMGDDDPQQYIHELLWSLAYTQRQYGFPVIGEEEIFKSMTRQDVLEYYGSRYVPSNMALSIAGDVSREDAFLRVKQVFGDIAYKEPPAITYEIEPAQEALKEKTEYFDTRPAILSIAMHTTRFQDQDTCALDVLATIMGDGRNSALNSVLKVEKQLVYSVVAYNYTPSFPGLFEIQCALEKANIERVKKEVFSVIDGLKTREVDENTLLKAKNILSLNVLLSLQTVEAQSSDAASSALMTGDPDFIKKYLEGVSKVTAEDVLYAARKYLKKDNMTIVALEPKVETGPGEPVEVEHKKYIPMVRYQGKAATGALEHVQAELKPQDIQMRVLKNGARLLLRQDQRLPIVTIRVSMLGGLRAEDSGNNGISNLCSSMLLSGTRSKDTRQMAEAIDMMGGSFSTESGSNSISIYANVLSKDLDAALALIAEVLSQANFPRRELDYEKKVTVAAIERQDKDIFTSSANILKKNLFARHPYGMRLLGTQETVEKLSRRDIASFYKKFVTPENMVISVYGDIDPEAALEKCEAIFGQLKKARFSAPKPLEAIAQKQATQISHTMKKKEALVLIGFKGATVYGLDRYALELLTSILSDADGKIFYRIRERLGIAYSLGSISVPGIEPGFYVFYVATSPDKLGLAREKLFEIIDDIKNGAITQEELQRAKTALIAGQVYDMQTNESMARQTSLDELYGLGYDDYLGFRQKIDSISKQDLVDAANKYFDIEKSVVVLTSPGGAPEQ